MLKKIKDKIRQNRLEEAIEDLYAEVHKRNNKQHLETIIIRQNDFNQLKQSERNGLIAFEQYQIVKHGIIHGILGIIMDLENDETENRKLTEIKSETNNFKIIPQQIKLNTKERTNRKSIFMFGKVASGKTTIISALATYLYLSPSYSIRYNLEKSNKEGAILLIEEVETMLNGEFMQTTPVLDTSIEIDLGIEYLPTKEYYPLTFIETSGEVLEKIPQTNYETNNSISKYLENSEIYFLIVSVKEASKSDHMTLNFLEQLKNNSRNISVGLILTKWDLFESPNEVSLKEFIISEMPYTAEVLLSDFITRHKIFNFSVLSTEKREWIEICEPIINWIQEDF